MTKKNSHGTIYTQYSKTDIEIIIIFKIVTVWLRWRRFSYIFH